MKTGDTLDRSLREAEELAQKGEKERAVETLRAAAEAILRMRAGLEAWPQIEKLLRAGDPERAVLLIRSVARRRHVPIAWILTIVFAATGLRVLFFGLDVERAAQASTYWPTVEGRILSSEVAVRRHGSRQTRTTYLANVEYAYEVGGVARRSTSVSLQVDPLGFAAGASGSVHALYHTRGEAEAVVARYPPGKTVRVHYDPDDPDRAVLEPGSSSGISLITAVGIVMIAIGLSVPLLWLLRRKRRDRRVRSILQELREGRSA